MRQLQSTRGGGSSGGYGSDEAGAGYGGGEPPPPGDTPAFADGDLRLVGRVDINGFATGALQLYHDGEFGAVCAKEFDAPDAAVACRQLGFDDGVVIRPLPDNVADEDIISLTQDFLAPFVIENLGCAGDEASVLDCPVAAVGGDGRGRSGSLLYNDYGPEGCAPYPASRTNSRQSSYAFVACSLGADAEEGDLRLSEGATAEDGSAQFGRLEVFSSGGWGTYCSLLDRFASLGDPVPFTPPSAQVACRQLGFEGGMRIQSQEDFDFGEPTNLTRIPIAVAGADCSGSEATLLSCPRGLPNLNVGPPIGCDHNNDVYLVCSSGESSREGDLRLQGGEVETEFAYGRLEVFLRGFWSDICPTENFTPDSAQVACRQLGYDGGASLLFPRPFEFGSRFVNPNLPLEAYLPVGLAAVDCAGDEARLAACPSDPAAIPRCANTTDSTVLACANAAADCGIESAEEEGAVRLVGGFDSPCSLLFSGIVEIFHDGEWGAICGGRIDPDDDPFGTLAPDVVCRQLGFPHGTVVDALEPGSSDNVEESQLPVGRIWLQDLLCRGREERVLDCDTVPGRFLRRRSEESFGSCPRSSRRLHVACRQFAVEAALEEVTTPEAEEGDLRLLGQETVENWITGELEVYFEGSWSQVCATNFDDRDAAVACRQLGFGAGSVVTEFRIFAGAEVTDVVDAEVAVTNSACRGRERRLLDCRLGRDFLRRTTSRECQSARSFPLRLACVTSDEPGEEGALRLRAPGGGPVLPAGADSGIPEVFHAGAWGTFCRSRFFGPVGDYDPDQPFRPDPDNAVVLCRQLGFQDGFLFTIEEDTLALGTTLAPPWLGGFRCEGTEAAVLDCALPGFGNTVTCGPPQRLFCSPVDEVEGTARLMDGSADAGGAWEYGRLEIVFDGFWTRLSENDRQALGRRGAAVVCRSLGYSAGAQMYASNASPLPGDGADARAVSAFACRGDEESLADCTGVGTRRSSFEDVSNRGGLFDVVVLCTDPSGCEVAEAAPEEGDVRLVPIVEAQQATASCDAVHFGGVEIFHNGRWGRVCVTDRVSAPDLESSERFVLDAQVVCRQLGFPFGGIYDAGEFRQTDFLPGDYVDKFYTEDYDPQVAFATEVRCTGQEDRLDACVFPEAFGDGDPSVSGVDASCTVERRRIFSVICRQFEITESNLIR